MCASVCNVAGRSSSSLRDWGREYLSCLQVSVYYHARNLIGASSQPSYYVLLIEWKVVTLCRKGLDKIAPLYSAKGILWQTQE